MRQFFAKTMICGVLTVGILASSGVNINADGNSELVDNVKGAIQVMSMNVSYSAGHGHGCFKTVLDNLVQEGKLTKDKADKIKAYVEQKRDEFKDRNDKEQNHTKKSFRHGLLDEMIKEQVITEEEAAIIRSKFRELKEQKLNDALEQMVQQGTITTEQKSQVKAYLEKHRQEKIEMHQKLKSMTEEQRTAFFKEHQEKRNVLRQMIDDNIMTKEQAEEFKKLLREKYDK